MAKLQELRIGSLSLLSGHPVLDQFARDLAAGVDPENLPSKPVTVYVGLHRKYGLRRLRRGKRVVLQTEHYFDADGQPMWRRMKRWRTFLAVLLAHHVLDLSVANRPHYDFLPAPLRRRVRFGPHVFPCHQPPHQPGQTPAFLFFGELNARRQALIDALPAGMAQLAPHGTFGEDLQRLVTDASGILNLHFVDGRYSEIPRLLSACLAGKPVMSEPLGDGLVAGREYLALGQAASAETARNIHHGFWVHFAERHGFARYLRGLLN